MTENNPIPPVDPIPPPPMATAPSSIPSATPPSGYTGPEPDQDSKTMAMLAHLLTIVSGFVGPLIIWLLKKDTSPFVDDQGKESLNFQLTCLIGYVLGGATTFVCVGFLIIPAVAIFHLIFAIMAGMKANQGIAYRYPVSIRFIK